MLIVLDEDLSGREIREALLQWYNRVDGPPVRGLDDSDLLACLRQFPDCVFVTNNTRHYWRRYDGEPRYCTLCLDLNTKAADVVAPLVRVVLSLAPFNSYRKRRGLVLKATPNQVGYYRRLRDEIQYWGLPRGARPPG